jgi:hypothetical protein
MASIANPTKKRISKSQHRQLKKQQAAKARRARRQLRQSYDRLPDSARRLLQWLAPAFTKPSFLRFALLTIGYLLTLGPRTVCNVLRLLSGKGLGHASSCHRLLSMRRWDSWALARLLIGWIFRWLVPEGPVMVVADDTVTEHPGRKVYGKGRHRDPVRSSHSYTAYRWGHRWVVLAILVRFPFSHRRWALPVLVALYQTESTNRQHNRSHKTPSQLLAGLLCVLMRWFPDRQFVCTADSNYGGHDLARLAARSGSRLSYVSRFYADAHLVEPPPVYSGSGRPRKKGARLPAPQEVVAETKERSRLQVGWYGGGQRQVEVVTGTGQWEQSGSPLVEVRWVYVHDKTGTHRDDYFFSSDVSMSAARVIEIYTGRWNLETTFQEMRSHLGLESSRGRHPQTVLRAEPCQFGLYTVVALLYQGLPKKDAKVRGVSWPGKAHVTFSDAITCVRRWLWQDWVLAEPKTAGVFKKLPREMRQTLLEGLAPAA